MAQAIDARGLSRLTFLNMTGLVKSTATAIRALAHAVIKGCPIFESICLDNVHDGILYDVVEAMGTDSWGHCPLARERMHDIEMGWRI